MTITYPKDASPTKETFGVGARIDVPAGKVHEVWMGSEGEFWGLFLVLWVRLLTIEMQAASMSLENEKGHGNGVLVTVVLHNMYSD